MKRMIHCVLLLSAALLMNEYAGAQGTVIHYWNFNKLDATKYYTTDGSTPLIRATYSIIDTNTATIEYGTIPGTSAEYSSYYDGYDAPSSGDTTGESYNMMAGDTVGESLRTRNPSDSMQLLFYIPSTNHQNLTINYVCEASNNGMREQVYSYSTDSGHNWKTTALSMTSRTLDSAEVATWQPYTISLNDAADDTIKNNPRLVFRITFMINDTGTQGNNRFDNVSVVGDTFVATVDTTSGVATVAPVAANGYSLIPNPAGNYIYVASVTGEARNIEIFNAIGQKIYSAKQIGNKAPVDIAGFSAGEYYMNIRSASGGRATTLRFVKQ